jgi:hypothetical protein
MPRWEYRTLDLSNPPPRHDAEHVLNDAGAEGWELVAVSTYGMAYLKRPIDEPLKSNQRRTRVSAANQGART